MTTLKHKTPCNECPWRREHLPGWLGGFPVEAFLNQVQYDGPPLPCHRTIEPGQEVQDATAMCAGALIFMKNSCKSAQHPEYGDALDQVEKDTETVFQWPHEFRAHHEQDTQEWVRRKMEDAAIRKSRFARMAANTDDSMEETTIFGVKVSSMSSEEKSIALGWALTQLNKKMGAPG